MSAGVQASVRLPGRVRKLLAAYALSCVGNGLIYPFTAVYLVEYRELGAGTGGLFFVVIAATSFAWAPVAGRLVDSLSPSRISATGVGLQALGFALLAVADSTVIVAVCALLVGMGNGSFYPAFTPVMAALLRPEQRKRGFAARYLAINLGTGLGAGIAGLLVDQFRTTTAFSLLYIADAATFLPFLVALAVLGRGARRALDAAATGGRGSSYRSLLRDRPLLTLLAVQTFLVLFGYSQMDTAVPLLMTQRLAIAASVVGLVIMVNTIAVVVLQAPMTRLLERYPSAPVLAGCSAVFAGAAGLGLVAALGPDPARIPLMLGYAVVFAVGEAFFAISFHTLLTQLTPAELLGRGSALSSLSWNIGAMGGPALGIALVTSSLSVTAYWAGYGAMLLATSALALTLPRGEREPA